MRPASKENNTKCVGRILIWIRHYTLPCIVGVTFFRLLLVKRAHHWAHEHEYDMSVDLPRTLGRTGRNESQRFGEDESCLFRKSLLHRRIYIYPDYGSEDWKGQILSVAGQENRSLPWPWLEMDLHARRTRTSHYNMDGQHGQYATELIIRDLFMHPKSCLRTDDPEQASLFFVPYLSSTEHHAGNRFVNDVDNSPSPFGRAIHRILQDDDYKEWEMVWGLTSKYWQRNRGVDHILVFSEPLQGLWHEGHKRGNYQYIHTQQQLAHPIVVSVELSRTFVRQYPHCAEKNILLPYPNPDGRWYNGYYDNQVKKRILDLNMSVLMSPAALPAEKILASKRKDARPAAYFYYALPHGSCPLLRKALMWNYMQCSNSSQFYFKMFKSFDYRQNMRLSTFCPCPAGDSPSAKRMFDAIFAGCIPVVLSQDFVWPLTTDVDPISFSGLDPGDFSLRLPAGDYSGKMAMGSCLPSTTDLSRQTTFDETLQAIGSMEIDRLRTGIQKLKKSYAWYLFDEDMPDNPLAERVLPNGGLAFTFVQELERRVGGAKWIQCEGHLNQTKSNENDKTVDKFQC